MNLTQHTLSTISLFTALAVGLSNVNLPAADIPPSLPKPPSEKVEDATNLVKRALMRHGEIVVVSRTLGLKETGEDLYSSLLLRPGYDSEAVIQSSGKAPEPNLDFTQTLRAALLELNPELAPGTEVRYFVLKRDVKDGEKVAPVSKEAEK